ncbi:MAG: hypothetical protein HY917_01970, partial [Candidatus Diapherotrites archaeon]|nr:hypothetical protein [Candidatus Diapherotrites archaeon]
SLGNDSNSGNNELQATLPVCEDKKVLFVLDNDGQSSAGTQSDDSAQTKLILERNGYCTETWNETEQGTPTLDKLNDFNAVIWSTGNYWASAIDETDAGLLAQFNGHLLLEGADIAFDHNSDLFMQNTVRAQLGHDLILNGNDALLQLTSSPLLNGVTELQLDSGISPYPDSVSALNGAQSIAGWNSGGSAILTYENGNHKLAYFAFPLNAITNAVTYEKLLLNAVSWLTAEPLRIQSVSPIIVNELQPAVIDVNVLNAQGPLSYSISDPRFDLNENRFTWIPGTGDSGTYTLTLNVSGGISTGSADVNVVVLNSFDAECVFNGFPSVMEAGETQAITLRFENTGLNTWTAQQEYKLVVEPSSNYWNDVKSGLTRPIGRGDSFLFELEVKAPTIPGDYNSRWRMAYGPHFFGAECSKTVWVRSTRPIECTDVWNIESTATSIADKNSIWANYGTTAEFIPAQGKYGGGRNYGYIDENGVYENFPFQGEGDMRAPNTIVDSNVISVGMQSIWMGGDLDDPANWAPPVPKIYPKQDLSLQCCQGNYLVGDSGAGCQFNRAFTVYLPQVTNNNFKGVVDFFVTEDGATYYADANHDGVNGYWMEGDPLNWQTAITEDRYINDPFTPVTSWQSGSDGIPDHLARKNGADLNLMQ